MKLNKVIFTCLLACLFGTMSFTHATSKDVRQYTALVKKFPPKVQVAFNNLVENKEKLKLGDGQLLNAAQIIQKSFEKNEPVAMDKLQEALPSIAAKRQLLKPLFETTNASLEGAREIVAVADEWLKEIDPGSDSYQFLSDQFRFFVKELSPQATIALTRAIITAIQQGNTKAVVEFFKSPAPAFKDEIDLHKLTKLGFEFPRFRLELNKLIKAQRKKDFTPLLPPEPEKPVKKPAKPVKKPAKRVKKSAKPAGKLTKRVKKLTKREKKPVKIQESFTVVLKDGREEKVQRSQINKGYGPAPKDIPFVLIRVKYIDQKGKEISTNYFSESDFSAGAKDTLSRRYPHSHVSDRMFKWEQSEKKYIELR